MNSVGLKINNINQQTSRRINRNLLFEENRRFKVGKQQILTLFIFLFCFAGFTYQASIAAEQYFEYKTISVVKLEEATSLDYPGVTLCNGPWIADSKLREWYPGYDSSNKSLCLKQGLKGCTSAQIEDALELYNNFTTKARTEKPILDLFGADWFPWCWLQMQPKIVNVSSTQSKSMSCGEVSPMVESLRLYNGDAKCFTYFSQLNKGLEVK